MMRARLTRPRSGPIVVTIAAPLMMLHVGDVAPSGIGTSVPRSSGSRHSDIATPPVTVAAERAALAVPDAVRMCRSTTCETSGVGSTAADGSSRWQAFLSGKTGAQRFVLALGALAAAVLAIGGVVAGAVRLLDGDDARSTLAHQAGEVQRIENQSESADAFVRDLLDAADERIPLELDHQVYAPRGTTGPQHELQYNCELTPGCNLVRLEPGDAPRLPDSTPERVWYQGCYTIERDGNGFGADRLDIVLTFTGATCPG